VNERTCKRCGRETWSPHSPYCRAHRPSFEKRQLWAKKSRTARGYGEAHKAMRARYARLVEAGQAICARCRRPIFPGEPWDLGHVDGDRSRYAGPEHRRCNRHAGAKQGAAITNQSRRPVAEPAFVRRWSRNWSAPDPPPPGVIVLSDH
jgi:hypothetical protein